MAHYTLKKVDDKLWREVKILVARRGITIKSLIINFLKEATKNNETEITSSKTIAYPYAKYVGMQEDPKGPAIPIYNIVGGKRHGSTVSKETLEKEGIKILE